VHKIEVERVIELHLGFTRPWGDGGACLLQWSTKLYWW